MRITYDHQFASQQYGGVSRYVCELMYQLAATYTQDIYAIAPLYANQYLRELTHSPVKIWGKPIGRIPKMGRIVNTINFSLLGPLLRGLNPDIVHQTFYSSVGFVPPKSKLVVTVYDMIHELFAKDFRDSHVVSNQKAAAVARADHIICISQNTQQDLVRFFGVNPDKTSVVHLGFTLTSRSTETFLRITDRPYLLYVGGREGYKNFAFFLKAIASSDFLRTGFVIICFGSSTFTKSERRLISDLGFPEDSVCQVSGSDAVLAGLYRHARAFIYPSLYEGFGIPPLEAMSFSCPVACSNVSSIPEVVGKAGAYFDPNNLESMRFTIEKVVTDETYRDSLIEAGKTRVKLFSWEQCAAETLEIYRGIGSLK
jgi:glycosyltransferase involved in cell wall biosynthesis